MKKNRIFLSYIHRASDAYAIQLNNLLTHCGLHVYSYQKRRYRTKIGTNIHSILKDKISKCDYFISILPKSIFCADSDLSHIQTELKYAYECKDETGSPNIFIICENVDSIEFDDSELNDQIKESYNLISDISVEASHEHTRRFCSDMGIAYLPLTVYRRLPLQEHLESEITKLNSSNIQDKENTMGVFDECMKVAIQLECDYQNQKYDDCKEAIEYIRFLLKKLHHEIDVAYLDYLGMLINFEILTNYGNSSTSSKKMASIRDNIQSYNMNNISKKSKINMQMLRGLVDYELGNIENSRKDFIDTYVDLCEILQIHKEKLFNPNGFLDEIQSKSIKKEILDTEEEILGVLTYLAAEALTSENKEDVARWLDELASRDISNLNLEVMEKCKYQILMAIGYMFIDEGESASKFLRELANSGSYSKDSIEMLGNFYFNQIDILQGENDNLLKEFLLVIDESVAMYGNYNDNGKIVLMRLKAYISVFGDIERSIEIYHDIISLCPDVPEYKMELGILYYKVSDIEKSNIYFDEFKQNFKFGLSSNLDYYNLGFVNWLQGDTDKAKSNFDESEFPESKNYENI